MTKTDVIKFTVDRNFAALARNSLSILETLKKNHEIQFDKLRNNLPAEFAAAINLSDYFDDKFYALHRKHFLDFLNSSKRDIETLLNEIEGIK